MAVLLLFLGFFLFLDSNSFAQVYKYVDAKGTVCLTDNPPSSLFKDDALKDNATKDDGSNNEEPKTKQVAFQRKKSKPEIRDILQLGRQILEEELAKPPEKQNRLLIEEMGIILYGDVSKHKIK